MKEPQKSALTWPPRRQPDSTELFQGRPSWRQLRVSPKARKDGVLQLHLYLLASFYTSSEAGANLLSRLCLAHCARAPLPLGLASSRGRPITCV